MEEWFKVTVNKEMYHSEMVMLEQIGKYRCVKPDISTCFFQEEGSDIQHVYIEFPIVYSNGHILNYAYYHKNNSYLFPPQYFKKSKLDAILQDLDEERSLLVFVWLYLAIKDKRAITVDDLRLLLQNYNLNIGKISASIPTYEGEQDWMILLLTFWGKMDYKSDVKIRWDIFKLPTNNSIIFNVIQALLLYEAPDKTWTDFEKIKLTEIDDDVLRNTINVSLCKLLSANPNGYISPKITDLFPHVMQTMIHVELLSMYFSCPGNSSLRKIYIKIVNSMRIDGSNVYGLYENFWSVNNFDFAQCDEAWPDSDSLRFAISQEEVLRMSVFYETFMIEKIEKGDDVDVKWFTSQLFERVVRDHIDTFVFQIPANHDTSLITEHFLYKVYHSKFYETLKRLQRERASDVVEFITAFDQFADDCEQLHKSHNYVDLKRMALTVYTKEDMKIFHRKFKRM